MAVKLRCAFELESQRTSAFLTLLPCSVFLLIIICVLTACYTPDYDTELSVAAKQGDLQLALECIEAGADVNSAQEFDRAPLHHAAYGGHLDVARALLDHGADCDARDMEGFTPVHLAAEMGHLETAEFLLRRGTDVNARSYSSLTPLHVAVNGNNLNVVKLLLASGADRSMTTSTGWTALDFARFRGFDDIADFLSESGD